ncbi:hypothetical protein GA0070613_2455 [Micromonospora inositola]|uniref:Uncharacterized protein n=2 Tax=Micromonospora inositola TaxID=47865 RepID=A0A1C5I8L9_9ACTN|nr:hypothetical protein GA0070613_2455 [Micromonospora inositola]
MPKRAYVYPRMLAGAALLVSILAALWLTLTNTTFPVFLLAFWLPVVIAAIPVMTVHGKPFRFVCRICAALLLALAVVGEFFGLSLHLPAALILVIAGAVDPGRVPGRARVAAIAGGLVSVMAVVGFAAATYRSVLSPPDAFIVHTTSKFIDWEEPYRSIVEGDGSGIGYGARGVSVGGGRPGEGPTLHVHFRKDLSTEERERLRRHLLELPEIRDVRLCNRRSQEC